MKHPCPKCGKTLMRGSRTAAGKQRWQCLGPRPERAYCYSTTNPVVGVRKQNGTVKRSVKTPVFTRTLGRTEVFLVTWAQNGTPVHKDFIKSAEAFCNHRSGELLVIPGRYKNPTSRWTRSQENQDVWAPEVIPYLFNTRKKLNKNLVVLGDVKVQPTAASPLTGFEGMTHGESGILGHPKLQLTTVPTPQSRTPKILTTTGACTVRNYSDTRAGKTGEFHHTLGAAVVEIQGGKFHLRQVNAEKDSGHFFDLDTCYMPQGHIVAGGVEALVMGDWHTGFTDPAVVRATFGPGGMVETLKPKALIWHDVSDGYSVNHHHQGNPFNRIAKRRSGWDDAEGELNRVLDEIQKHTPPGVKSVIVASNHDDFLRQWIIANDWRSDPTNAEFYLRTALAMVERTTMGPGGTEYPSPFVYWARARLPAPQFLVLDGSQSYQIKGIELSMHGNRGPNGARGSRKNLRRIGVKSMIAHGHGPGIEEGCTQVGTSTWLSLEYTGNGPSNWLQTHGVIYSNGKRSLYNIIDGDWRLV